MADFRDLILENFSDDDRDIIMRYLQSQESGAVYYIDSSDLEPVIDFFLQLGDRVKAQEALDRAMSLNGDSNELLFRKAQIIKNEKPDEALALVEKIVARSFDADYLRLKIEILFDLSRTDEAASAFSQFISSVMSTERGYILYEMGYYIIATKAFMSPEVVDAPEWKLGISYLCEGNRYVRDVEEVLNFAEMLSDFPQAEAAKLLYEHALDLDPYNEDAWAKYSKMLFDNELYSEALDAIGFCEAIGVSDTDLNLYKGDCLLNLEHYEKALDAYRLQTAVYEEQSATGEQRIRLTLGIAECHEMLKNYEQASLFYSTVLLAQPETFDAAIGLANCYINQKEYASAVALLVEKIETFEKQDAFYDASDFYTTLGEAYTNWGDESDDNSYFYLAVEAYKSAVMQIRQQYDLYGQSPWSADTTEIQAKILANIGNLYLQTANYNEALDNYLQAYYLAPKLNYIHVTLAMTYYNLGLMAQALEHYCLAQQLDTNARALFLESFPDAQPFIDNITNDQLKSAGKKDVKTPKEPKQRKKK